MEGHSMDASNAWVFSYKSQGAWSTTGQRWHGYVKLLKSEALNNHNVEIQDVDCMVDCDCPDYRYRFAYGNTEQGASITGDSSWNKNNGHYPNKMGKRVGLCKHLMSLVEYLGTKVEPVAPEPTEPPPIQRKAGAVKKGMHPSQYKNLPKKYQTYPSTDPKLAQAPEPPKTTPYSDTRSGDLFEGNGSTLFERISSFVKSNPQFAVEYYDDMQEELLNEDAFHDHDEWTVYEGYNKITILFKDNTKLFLEVGYPAETWGEDKDKWKHKAASKWKTLARKIHDSAGLSKGGNPINIPWKECYQEALQDPEMKQYIRKNARPIFESYYTQIGHNDCGKLWIWKNEELHVIDTSKVKYHHHWIDQNPELHNADFMGRFDPIKNIISVVDMGAYSDYKNTSLSSVPPELIRHLKHEFGEYSSLIPHSE
jgi:hypothetical protein